MDVSVVIPMYNAVGSIGEQLGALAKQDFAGSWEIFIVDNGSTDDGPRVAANASLPVPITVLFAPDQQGPPYARNIGAHRAGGRYLAFADADDVATPGWLSGLMACASPDAICMGVLDPRPLNSITMQKARGSQPNESAPPGPLGLMPSAWGSNMLISRDLFDQLGGFNPDLLCGDDADLSYRAQLAGNEIRFAPLAVMNYRYRPDLRGLYRQMREWGT
ncbi:MAG: glycosyltransferase, partial [Lacisediminihabitans sp.]